MIQLKVSRRSCTLSLILLLSISGLLAQTGSTGRASIQPSPDAQALGRYGDVPVSYYTGRPSITIPLSEISEGPLRVPIALNYYSGGHQVNEIASWVGLGWTLSCNAAVTRVVRGLPDEINSEWSTYFSKPISTIFGDTPLTQSEQVAYLESVNKGCIDIERDIYYFNFNGNSGKFFLDWDGKVISNSDRPIKIVPIYRGTNSGVRALEITSWQITDEFGSLYDFSEVETTINATAPQCHVLAGNFNSTWHLSKVTDVNNENEIDFSYTRYTWTTPVTFSERKDFGGISLPSHIVSEVQLQYNAPRLSKIAGKHCGWQVEFNVSSNKRNDVGTGNDQVKALESVAIKYNGEENRTFSLIHSIGGKLQLSQIIESIQGKRIKPPYQFEYNGFAVNYQDRNQDHWGFYNKAHNSTLIPFLTLNPLDPMTQGLELFPPEDFGADRTPNFEGSVNGVLGKITYPTGAKTEFVYEANDYSSVQTRDVEADNLFVKNLNTQKVSLSVAEAKLHGASKSVDVSLTQGGWVKFRALGNSSHTKATISNSEGVLQTIKFARQFEKFLAFELQPGNYTLKVEVPLDEADDVMMSVQMDYYSTTTERIFKKQTGGVRIKETRDYPIEGNPVTRKFFYTLSGLPYKSSGVIYDEPQYTYRITEYQTNASQELAVNLAVRLSQNRSVLGETQGSHVGYSEVLIQFMGGGNNVTAQTLYKFNSPKEFPDVIMKDFPFAPPVTQGFKTGLLKEQIDFKKESGAFSQIRKVMNDYQFKTIEWPAQKIGFKGGAPGSVNGPYRLDKYVIGPYKFSIGLSQLMKSTEQIFQNGQTVTQITNFNFDDQLQNITSTSTPVASDEEVITEYTYPQDISDPSAIVEMLKSKNVFGSPIETVLKRKKGTSEYVLGGSFTEFDPNANKVRVKSSHQLNLSKPMLSSDFRYSRDNQGAPDTHYTKELTLEVYDDRGNPVQTTPRSGNTRSVILDYFEELPIADVVNANVSDIAYTSFEADGRGGWLFDPTNRTIETNSFTGKKSFDLGGSTISKNSLSLAKNYLVSYWTNGPALKVSDPAEVIKGETINGWTRYEHSVVLSSLTTITISPPDGATGEVLVDELRLHPADAFMTTYTYDPQSGGTSSTDANGRTTYFEYDLSRLKLIRDTDKNILKFFDYQYKSK